MHMKLRVSLVFAALALFFAVTPVQATFPGENGKIVFVGNQSGTWQLYTINPDGSDMIQITNFPPTIWETWYPAFSPDGKRIAFGRDTLVHPCNNTFGVPASGCADLYVINADGTGLIQLTHDGLSSVPRWSQDGTRIVFNHVRPLTGESVIATMSADGTGGYTFLTSGFWGSYIGTYTPDGTQIVFESQLDGFVSAAWSMNIDGSRQRRLTPAPLEAGPFDLSPDGSARVNRFETLGSIIY
jgi:Tol biopolymer transport system component